MKKVFSFFFALCCAVCASAANYNLWVAGVRVTDANKDGITGAGISGTISFNPTTNVLFMKNAKITCSGTTLGIYATKEMGDLNIHLNGDNSITTDIADGISYNGTDRLYFGANSVVNSLTIKSKHCAIKCEGSMKVDNNVTLNLTSEQECAIKGGASGTLTVSYPKYQKSYPMGITLNGKTGVISGFKDVEMTNAYYNIGQNYRYDTTNKAFGYPSGSNTVQATSLSIKNGVRYPILVNGNWVASDNMDDVLGDGKVYLDLKYVDTTGYFLILKNGARVITLQVAKEADHSVHFGAFGDVYVKNTGSMMGVTNWSKQNMTLYCGGAEGSWNIETADNAIDIQNGSVSLSQGTFNIKSKTYGIMCNGNICSFSVANVNIDAEKHAVWMRKDCDFITNMSFLTSSESGKRDKTSGYFKDKDGKELLSLKWKVGYGFTVKGKWVDTSNYQDILGDGKMSYDIHKKIIHMNGVNLTSEGDAIMMYEGKTIELSGKNTINAEVSVFGVRSFCENQNFGIVSTDGGSLTSDCEYFFFGRNSQSNRVNVQDCDLNIKSKYGPFVADGNTTELSFKKANVKIDLKDGYKDMPFYGYKSVTLDGCYMSIPLDYTFDNGCLIDSNGNTKFNYVELATTVEYPVMVGGIQVTSDNCHSFYNNSCSYDHATHTLTLNNASIANDGRGISIDAEQTAEYTIMLKGWNHVVSQRSEGIYTRSICTIMSDCGGSLDVQAFSSTGISHRMRLAFKDCSVNVNGYGYGIAAYWYDGAYAINIDNADVTASGTTAAFFNYQFDYLDNCSLVEPSNAVFDKSKGSFYVGSDICKKVVIVSNTTGIDSPNADILDFNDSPAFSLSGARVSDSYKGIVVKNGRKFWRK